MFAHYDTIKKRITNIQSELHKIEALEKRFPEEELICARNGKYYKWYLKNKDKDKLIHLSKQNEELARRLTAKRYYKLRKQDLTDELAACEAYMRKANRFGNRTEKMLEHDEYARLLDIGIVSKNKELQEWMAAKYERNIQYPEKLIVKGTQGKFLRSKSEAIIDRILYGAGIPFHYEEKLVLGGITVSPDFTIRHPKTGEFFYWEHLGMMDNEDYVNHACEKLRLYCENNIIPSVNLILTYETKEYPLAIGMVERLVNEYFQ